MLPDHDGLSLPWPAAGYIYVNPPYGRDASRGTTIKGWLKKAAAVAASGAEVLALIPVATNTRHWKDFVFKATRVCFLADTRLKFYVAGKELDKGAPMACAMVYWGTHHTETFTNIFSQCGSVVTLVESKKSLVEPLSFLDLE